MPAKSSATITIHNRVERHQYALSSELVLHEFRLTSTIPPDPREYVMTRYIVAPVDRALMVNNRTGNDDAD